MKDSNNWQNKAKDNPFKVPHGYFESFEGRMMDRIAAESNLIHKRIIPMPVIRWITGIAAVFIMGFIGVQQFYMKPQQVLMNQEAMYEVLAYYAQDMDDASFSTMMADNKLLPADDAQDDAIDIVEWMDVDEMIIIDAMIEMAY
ncbi:MAG: hypothetical protein KAH17_07375 [Bacteroidales bacterium]|nr:hypothetical protein [Bacteroidales bacterium]